MGDVSAAPDRSRPLAWGFLALAVATYGLIVLGALVRAHGAGLACPDWPLCFGRLVPPFDLRVAFEWSHRLLAGGVALGLAALTALIVRRPAARERLRVPLRIAWSLLGAQVLLGGATVLLQLAPWTVTAHLLVGNSLCLTLLWSTRTLFEADAERAAPPERAGAGARTLLLVTALLLALQLTLGGLVSSHAAGLACPDFPSCDGRSWAPTLSGLIGLHVQHRAVGFSLLASYLALAWTTRGLPRTGALARVGARLMLLQIVLGVANVLLRLPVELTALHSAVAAALVLVTGLVVREILRVRSPERRSRAAAPQALEVP
ncbi:MAG: heme A synthase [Myxococcota bacterium]